MAHLILDDLGHYTTFLILNLDVKRNSPRSDVDVIIVQVRSKTLKIIPNLGRELGKPALPSSLPRSSYPAVSLL